MSSKKPTKTRRKSSSSPKNHTALCGVCKSAYLLEIERDYHDFRSIETLVNEYGVLEHAIRRHVNYFGLDLKRAENTSKVLLDVISRGFSSEKQIPPKVALGAVQELHKVLGKHKAPETNPNDVQRDLEGAVLDFIKRANDDGHNISPDEARRYVEPRLESDAVN